MALLTPSAHGAATRAEYAAQVNPICVASDAQVKAATRAYDKKLRAQLKKGKLNLKQYERVARGTITIEKSTLAQIAAIAAAPGDENLVAEFVRNRSSALTVYGQTVSVFVKLLRLDPSLIGGKPAKLPPKQVGKLVKLLGQFVTLTDRFERLLETDYLVGTELGLTACVDKPSGGGASASRSYAAVEKRSLDSRPIAVR
jgi:hypothetical protein